MALVRLTDSSLARRVAALPIAEDGRVLFFVGSGDFALALSVAAANR